MTTLRTRASAARAPRTADPGSARASPAVPRRAPLTRISSKPCARAASICRCVEGDRLPETTSRAPPARRVGRCGSAERAGRARQCRTSARSTPADPTTQRAADARARAATVSAPAVCSWRASRTSNSATAQPSASSRRSSAARVGDSLHCSTSISPTRPSVCAARMQRQVGLVHRRDRVAAHRRVAVEPVTGPPGRRANRLPKSSSAPGRAPTTSGTNATPKTRCADVDRPADAADRPARSRTSSRPCNGRSARPARRARRADRRQRRVHLRRASSTRAVPGDADRAAGRRRPRELLRRRRLEEQHRRHAGDARATPARRSSR